MRLHRLSSFVLAAQALVLVGACSGGQTGDLSGKGDRSEQQAGHENSGGCDEHRAEVGFDEETAAGTAEALLSYAERTFDSPLSWKTANDGQSWTVGPESGEGTLRVTVTRGAKAFVLTYTPPENDSGQEVTNVGVLCPPARLGVEAKVSVTTDGGALAESFDTVLRSETPGVAMLNVPFKVADLQGSLSVDSGNPNAELVQLGLDAVLTSVGTTGSISGLEQVTYGSGPNGTVSASAALLAVWPGGESCGAGEGLGVELEDDVFGQTGVAALAAVSPEAPVAVQWLDGGATTLDIGIASTGDGCFRVSQSPIPGDGGPVTQYPVTVTLQSADGRLDGSYSGLVESGYRNGERRVVATVALSLDAADVEQSGFGSPALPDGTERVLLQFEAGEGGGAVRLMAMSSSPCAMQASGGQGSGSPGCAGATQTQIEAASWAD